MIVSCYRLPVTVGMTRKLAMTIANRLRQYLESEKISYDIVAHAHTATSSRTAQAAHLSGELVVKSVVVHHELGYVLVVAPSTHRVELGTLQALLNRRLGKPLKTRPPNFLTIATEAQSLRSAQSMDCQSSSTRALKMFPMSISKAVTTRPWCMSPAMPSED